MRGGTGVPQTLPRKPRMQRSARRGPGASRENHLLGLGLLTLSGVGWLLLGYPFTPILVTKLALVATIWVVGPIIDNVVEPSFEMLAPGPGESPTLEFKRIQRRYLMLEAAATALFYVVIGLWVLR